MEDKSYNEIPDLSEDWGLDTRNGLPYSGKSVQDFIKKEIRKVLQGLDNKFGSVSFEGNRLVFYDEEGGLQVGSVAFSGTSYIVSVETNAPTAFTVLSSEESRFIKLTPSTKAYDMGGSESVDYPEDYVIKLEVDGGKGFVDKTPLNSVIRFGESLDVDIRQNLTTGLNRVRIVVTGLQSNQVRTLMFTVTLTSLYLTVEHPWNQTWIGGEDYMIRGIFFSGNIAKTLHVKVDGVEYTQVFSASNQYVNVPYSFDVTNKMPAKSGIVPVEMWMSGEGVQTDVIKFNLSYVAEKDVNKISLICINNVPSKVYNFSQERVLSYSVYNISELDIQVKANFGENEIILTDVHRLVQSQTIYDLDIALQIDTDMNDGITLTTTFGAQLSEDERLEEVIVLDVDNSNAFLAVEGAKFYLNPSLRSNDTADRYEWFNTASEAEQATYLANWDGFTFSDDAWSSDSDGNRALCVKAGSYVEVPELKLLSHSGSDSFTLEFMYRASNIADYDTPILSLMDTENYEEGATTGIMLFPTRLLVLTNNEKSEIFQQLPLGEDRIIHIAVVLHRQYANNAGRNLVRIFINGCENVAFSINAASTLYNAEGLNYLRLGQASTDTYLYMMRYYDRVLEGTDVVKNFLNALIDTEEISRAGVQKDNNLLDAGDVNYELAKKAGFNCFIVETDQVLPSLENPETESLRVDLHFEYNDYPEWNVSVLGVPLTGQGTTSLRYPKWNFRSKITDKSTVWRYNNMPDPFTGLPKEERGIDGYIAGYNLNPRVSRITAKKKRGFATSGT